MYRTTSQNIQKFLCDSAHQTSRSYKIRHSIHHSCRQYTNQALSKNDRKEDMGIKWHYTRESEASGDYITLRDAVQNMVLEGSRDAKLWQSYSHQLQELSSEMSAEDACFFLSSFAYGKIQDLNLTTKLSNRLREIENWDKEIHILDLKKLITAYGRSKVFDSELMRELVPTIIHRVEELSAEDLAQIIFSYSKIPVADGNLFSLVASVLPDYVYDLNPTEIAYVADAFATVSMYDESLFDALCQETHRRLRDFGARDYLIFFDSLSILTARLKEQVGHEDFPGLSLRDDKELWTDFLKQVIHVIGNYTFLDLLRFLILLQRVNYYETRLIHNRILPLMLTQLQRSDDNVPFTSLALTLQALSRLPSLSEVGVELTYELCNKLKHADKYEKEGQIDAHLMIITTLEAMKIDPETRNAALGQPCKGITEAHYDILDSYFQKMDDPPKRWMNLIQRREKSQRTIKNK